MRLTRRGLLGAGVAAAGTALVGRAGARDPADARPPKEAYQPTASKNWWYFNGHLYSEGELLYDFSAAFIADHGGDAAGHLMLFTLVGYEDDREIAEAHEGAVEPSLERYAASFTSPSATGAVRRTGADPFSFDLSLSPDADASLSLTYETDYRPKTREDYREGGGRANVLFWNQATCEGTVATPDGTRDVRGVGFLEHVWGTWSRAPQKGIDFLNGHLAAGGDGLPTGASVYFRRTFYQGTPATGGVLGDVGPVLYLTPDGETWYAAEEVECTFDGRPVGEHRNGTPDVGRIRGAFVEGGRLDVVFSQRRHATVRIPGEWPLGNVHEGAADLSGTLVLPGEARSRSVTGIAQTEHQRFGPIYPY